MFATECDALLLVVSPIRAAKLLYIIALMNHLKYPLDVIVAIERRAEINEHLAVAAFNFPVADDNWAISFCGCCRIKLVGDETVVSHCPQ